VREHDRRAHRGVSGERDLPARCEDPHPRRVRRVVRREDERGLRVVELARDRQHLLVREPPRIEDDGELSIPWFKERGYAPIERYRARDIVNWYFAPVEIAAKVNARETERGREERRKMEEMLAKEPSGSSVRAYWTPKYLLGPDGMPVLNPRWEPPEVWQRAAQEGGDPAKVGDDIAKEGGDAAPASAVVADAAAPSKAPGAATASSALTSPAPQRSEDALRPEEAPRPEAKPQGEGGH